LYADKDGLPPGKFGCQGWPLVPALTSFLDGKLQAVKHVIGVCLFIYLFIPLIFHTISFVD